MYVRTASDRDIASIRALLMETWHDTYDRIYGPDRVRDISERWHSVDSLRHRLTLPRSEYLVADDGTGIAGMAFAASDEKGETVTLHQLCVLPAWQRRRVGTMLLEEVFSSFPDSRAFRLEVEPENERAIAFYESHGFSLAGVASGTGALAGLARIYQRVLGAEPT